MYSWITEEKTYEGFPLFLRRPIDVDTPEHRQCFPNLAIITHSFSERLPDGRPEPQYNRKLEQLDHDIVTAFDASQSGLPILVEAFGGERNYYFCMSPEADISSIFAPIAAAHPTEQLKWERRSQNGWQFLDDYTASV